MKGGFDLSAFKKVHESKDHAVLEHPDGHQIKISKSALKPKSLKELAQLKIAMPMKMAQGGQVANLKEKYDPNAEMQEAYGQTREQKESEDPPFKLLTPEEQAARGVRHEFDELVARMRKGKKAPRDATKMAEGGQVEARKAQMLREFGARQAFAQKHYGDPFAKSSNADWADPRAAALHKMDAGLRERWPEMYSNTHMGGDNRGDAVSWDNKKTDWGAPKKMAEGGPVQIASPNPPGNIFPSSYDQAADVSGNMGSTAGGLPSPDQLAKPGSVFQPSGADQAVDQLMGAPKKPAAPQAPTQPANVILPDVAQMSGVAKGGIPGMNMQGVGDAMGQYMGQIERAYGQQAAGLRAQAAAEGRLGEREAAAAAADQSLKLLIKQNHEDEFNKLSGEVSAAIKDVDAGHIDPSHYISSKSTLGKVSTALGLALGGIGSGLTGQPNAALDFLNRQIDRDILAQRANLGRKETILGAYFKQMGNLNDATKMTWAFYNDLYTSELKKQAALVRDPMAKAEAQRLIGEREAQKAQVLAPLAFQRALMQSMRGGQADPASAIRLYGQLGILNPQQTTEGMKELQMLQNHEAQSGMILNAFDKSVQENTLGNRAAHLGYEPASVSQLKTLVMPYLKDSAGRVSEAELEILDGLIPKPGDTPYKAQEKRAGIVQFLGTKLSVPTLNSVGIYPQKPAQMLSKPNQKVIPGYNGGQ